MTCDVLVLFVIPELSAPRSVNLDRAPVAFLEEHLGNSRFFTTGPIEPNYGSYFGLSSLNAYDLPVASRYTTYVHARLNPVVDRHNLSSDGAGGASLSTELVKNLAGYRDAAVKYVLVPRGQQLPEIPGTFTLVFRSRSTSIYALAGSKPFFTVSGTNCSVSAAGTTAAHVTCANATTLVRRETSMPGWSVQVDGRDAAVKTVDGIFQAVAVRAGSHEVTFSFTPPHEDIAGVAFLLGSGWRPGRRSDRTDRAAAQVRT